MIHEHIPLLLRHLDSITVPNIRQAYLYLTHHAATLREYQCRPGEHGDINDFRYEQGSKWPYAFIVNQQSLLWYFRKAGLGNPAADLDLLREHFAEARENPSGEITVRVADIDDARRIAELVFGPDLPGRS